MGTTTGGLPYPEPTDPIAQGADAIKALALAVDPTINPTWTPLTPAANWVNLAGGYTSIAYCVTGKLVRLRGHPQYTGGTTLTASATCAILPAPARPSMNHDFAVWAGGTAAALRLSINTAGNVNVNFSGTTPGATNAWASLDGISFYIT